MEALPTYIGYALGIAGGFVMLFSRVKNENLKDLKERVEILENERELSRNQHMENQKAISNLEGQLSTYKEIPLKSIADSLQTIGQFQKDTARTNNLILKRLDKSAVISDREAHGGGLLVNTGEK